MIQTGEELAQACIDLVENHKTLYVLGCFGAPMLPGNKWRYIDAYSYNAREDRKQKIAKASEDTFGFDCVGMIKGLLWGWHGKLNSAYGGADYTANGIPDFNANQMISACESSTDFREIQVGEVVWIPDHIGVYIGEGKVVECTPRWNDGVQVTALLNIGSITGLYSRRWEKHGKLPWVSYTKVSPGKKTNTEIAQEVIIGKWGSGEDRRQRILDAGYDYEAIQEEVNKILKPVLKSPEEIAEEIVHEGKWGNGSDRKRRLEAAGYDYRQIQKAVNKLMEE